MLKPTLLAAFGVLLGACATPQSTTRQTPAPPAKTWATPEEEAAILTVVDKFLLAVGNRDSAAEAALMVPEGTTFLQRRLPAGDRPVVRRSNAELAAPAANPDPFIERYWSPVVQVRGGLAQVWAPYELRDNGQVVHCGVDAFQMVKLDGAWKVGNLISSLEPAACDELRPTDLPRSAMRPLDGWKETPLE